MVACTRPAHLCHRIEQASRPDREDHRVRAVVALEGLFSVPADGTIPYTRTQEHLFDLEAENAIAESDKAVYVLYPDDAAGSWRVQAVPVSSESFDSRKALPEAWRGLRDDVLTTTSGIPGGVFVHASGFIGGTFHSNLSRTPR